MAQFTTNNHLISVVDDDTAIARLVSVNLTARGYRVKEFDRGLQAIAGLKIDDPDLVIMDLMMPDLDGLEVTRQIRQVSQVPILILSVLDLGAEDYLTKPFRIEELLARTRAILRRTAPATKEDSLQSTWDYRSGELYVDLNGLRVVSHGHGKQLTPREWALLRVFIQYAGQVVAPRTLLKEAWGPNYGDEGDYVRTYVNRLRRKIEPEPNQPRYLLLELGLGYSLVEPA